ncbi:MAG: glycosyltransferase [Succinivibrio sp.]|nr:glycosyltransferase [Succinivibrio sp.]
MQNLFSIIIPTMQKDTEVLNKLLNELNEDAGVGEIIIIDNSGKGFDTNLTKVKVYVQTENLFVNPAWNLGIRLSNPDFKFFGTLNDDIIFPRNFFGQVLEFLTHADEQVGLVGIECPTNTLKEFFNEYPDDCKLEFSVIDKMQDYWGSAYFGEKSHYVEIPECMKIFNGDHFIFVRNIEAGRQNYKISGAHLKHLTCLTSKSSKSFDKIFKDDRKAAIKYGVIEFLDLNFWQRLFSIHYFHKHYVICLLGLKMKIKWDKAQQ